MYSLSGQLLYERINSAYRQNYYLGSQLIAHQGAGEQTFIHPDILGTTAGKTNSDGGLIKRLRYAPFGLEWGKTNASSVEDEIGYTGHKHDKSIGLTYMQARYYDPVIGRFYSNDPVDYLGHMQRGNSITHGFNRYAYVNNNPYKYVDPNGDFLKLAKAAFNVVKRTIKNGGDFKKAGKEELANLADNISTLADGQLNIDDAFAVIDLATGFGDEAKKANKALRTCCFVAGTQVLTEDGYKNIEDVKLGEKLWAKNTDTGEQDWKPVTKIFVEPDRRLLT